MAIVVESSKCRVMAKVKYSDGGVIKTATRTLGPGGTVSGNVADNPDLIEAAAKALQPIITDTIEGVYLEVTDYFQLGTGESWGTPGSIAAHWEGFDDVKLVNSYTNGDDVTSRETIKRVATGASEAQLKAYGRASANLDDDTTAISGYFTGTSIEAAWQND